MRPWATVSSQKYPLMSECKTGDRTSRQTVDNGFHPGTYAFMPLHGIIYSCSSGTILPLHWCDSTDSPFLKRIESDFEARKSPSESTLLTAVSTSHGTSHLELATPSTPSNAAEGAPRLGDEDSASGSADLFHKLDALELQWTIHKQVSAVDSCDDSSFLSLGSFSSPLPSPANQRPTRTAVVTPDSNVFAIPSDVLNSMQRRHRRDSVANSVSTRGGESVFDRLYRDAKQRNHQTRSSHSVRSIRDRSSIAGSSCRDSADTSRNYNDSVCERLYRSEKRRTRERLRNLKQGSEAGVPCSSLERRLSYQPAAYVTPVRTLRRVRDVGMKGQESVFERLYRNSPRSSRKENQENMVRSSGQTKLAKQNARRPQECVRRLILIQSVWRCYRHRRKYIRLRAHVCFLQRCLRGNRMRVGYQKQSVTSDSLHTFAREYWHQRTLRTYKELDAPATKIQSFWRAGSLRAQYTSLKFCAVLIQREFRRYAVRALKSRSDSTVFGHGLCRDSCTPVLETNETLTLRSEASASIIQSWYRTLVLREEYICLKHASFVVQQCYRRYRQQLQFVAARRIQCFIRMATASYRFLVIRHCAEVIQNFYRCYRASDCDMREIRQEEAAAVRVQSWWRASRLRIEFVWMRWQATVLQSYFREYLVRASRDAASRSFLLSEEATALALPSGNLDMARALLCIQSWWKCRQAVASFHRARACAVVIQRSYRRRCIRGRKVRLARADNLLNDTIFCCGGGRRSASLNATRIQALYRRRTGRKRYQAILRIAFLVQSLFRGRRARMELEAEAIASVTIERAFRGFVIRRSLHRQRENLVRIQATWRGFVVRQEVNLALRDRSEAAASIQRCYRGCAARESFFLARGAAVVIQQQVRRSLWTSEPQRQHRRREYRKAVVAIQAWVRLRLTICRMRTLHGSAVIVQRAYRGLVVRRRIARAQFAALTIQRGARLWAGTRQASIRRDAVVAIQAFWRGLRWRRLYQACGRTTAAAVLLQRTWRGYRDMKDYMFAQGAALMIQCQARRRMGLARFLARRREDYIGQVNAIRIQAMVRQHRDRSNYNLLHVRTQTIQRWYRRVEYCRRERYRSAAATEIQKQYRGLKGRTDLMIGRGAAVMIQCQARRLSARSELIRLQTLSAIRLASVVRIQASVRQFLTSRRWKTLFLSSLRVQRVFRGSIVREQASIRQLAAISVQKYCRGSSSRLHYMICRGAAVMIQCQARRLLARKELDRLFVSVLRLQAWIRQCAAAVLSKKFLVAALTLQRVARGGLIRIRDEKVRYAAHLIQRVWRVARTKRANAIVSIQSSWRRWSLRNELLQRRSCSRAAVSLQSLYRRSQERQRLLLQRSSAARIQRIFRLFKVRNRAAVEIQALTRGILFRTKLRIACDATRTIQAAYYTFRIKELLLKLQRAVSLLQMSFDGKLSRSTARFSLLQINSLTSCHTRRAFLRVQTVWGETAYLLEVEWSSMHSFAQQLACTELQRVWRGSHCRRTVHQKALRDAQSASTVNANRPAYSPLVSSERLLQCRTPVAVRVVEKLGPHTLRVELCPVSYLMQDHAARVLQGVARRIVFQRQRQRTDEAAAGTHIEANRGDSTRSPDHLNVVSPETQGASLELSAAENGRVNGARTPGVFKWSTWEKISQIDLCDDEWA